MVIGYARFQKLESQIHYKGMSNQSRHIEKGLRASGRSPEMYYSEEQGHDFNAENLNIQRKRIIDFKTFDE